MVGSRLLGHLTVSKREEGLKVSKMGAKMYYEFLISQMINNSSVPSLQSGGSGVWWWDSQMKAVGEVR